MNIYHANYKQLTVDELIKLLQSIPPDTLVLSQGCDCIEPAVGIILENNNQVIIAREWQFEYPEERIITDVT